MKRKAFRPPLGAPVKYAGRAVTGKLADEWIGFPHPGNMPRRRGEVNQFLLGWISLRGVDVRRNRSPIRASG